MINFSSLFIYKGKKLYIFKLIIITVNRNLCLVTSIKYVAKMIKLHADAIRNFDLFIEFVS